MDGSWVQIAVFLGATFAASFVAAISGFAFALISAAIWLHVLTPLQTVTLVISYAMIVQIYGAWRLRHAVRWARYSVYGTIVGIALISIATPMVSERIFHKWFDFPNLILLAPIPIMTGLLLLALVFILRELPRPDDRYCWAPFALTVAVFVLCFYGLAYSFFPYIVPERLTILEVASAPESLKIILVGVLIVFPFLIGYTILAYRVFHGKARDLSYD